MATVVMSDLLSATIEFPLFFQHCPHCHWIRVRRGNVWINEDPDEGWYDWWQWDNIALKIAEYLDMLQYPCHVCFAEHHLEGNASLTKSFGTLEVVHTLCRKPIGTKSV